MTEDFYYFCSKVYGKKNQGRSWFGIRNFTSANDACEKINKSENGWNKNSVRNGYRFEAGRIKHKCCTN